MGRRGPARGGENLGKSRISPQIAGIVPATPAPIARCLPPMAGSMQLAELHRTSYLRPSGSVVVPFERYNQHRISGTERSPSSSSLKRSCQVAQLYVALLQFIMAAFETTRVRPPATLVDYLCMLHVLTDVRSSRALRLCSASQFRRQVAAGSSGTQLSSALEHPVQRETTGAAQRE